jgi:ABC-2 type transport system permease protein
MHYQPFAGLLDFPLRIYSGNITGWGGIVALGRQALWIVVLIALGKLLMSRVMARLQAQGG